MINTNADHTLERTDLAAAFRWTARLNMHEGVANHFSAAVSDDGKQFLIKDSLPQLEWTMDGETKQIGQYMAIKATAVKKVDEMDFTNMRRRNRKNDGEKPKDSVKSVLLFILFRQVIPFYRTKLS